MVCSSWCFLCGKSSTDCPRGGGGCDAEGVYLERLPGWTDFALDGETAAFGAQQDFLRRRQAYRLRGLMEKTDATLWAALVRYSNRCTRVGRI